MATAATTYPETRYTSPASPPPDFTSKQERERLSGAALKAFFNIIERWSIRDEDARELLGGVSNGPYYQMKKSQEGRTLSADELFRISYLIGIFKALNTQLQPHLRRPNAARVHEERRPAGDGDCERAP